MTEERIEKLTRYAKKVWNRDYRYRDEPIEDFIQTFILFALENPEDTPALVLWKIANRGLHKNPYRMRYFSEIESDERYKNGARGLETILQVLEEGYELEETDSIDELAEMLFRAKVRERFRDYMHGQACGGEFQKYCRKVLFRKRFEILDYLLRVGKIAEREKENLEAMAYEMAKPAPVKTRKEDTPKRERQRRYDKSHPRKAYKRAWYEKRKQARQAEKEANSAKEI